MSIFLISKWEIHFLNVPYIYKHIESIFRTEDNVFQDVSASVGSVMRKQAKHPTFLALSDGGLNRQGKLIIFLHAKIHS